MPVKFNEKKYLIILVHVSCWLLLFALPWMLKTDRAMPDEKVLHENWKPLITLSIVLRLLWILIFYYNAFVLVPRFVYNRKYGEYILILGGILVGFTLIDLFFVNLFVEGLNFSIQASFSFNLIPLMFILVASYTYRITIDRLRQERNEKDKINETLKTELALLRSQVSPHFMFNVLNNMVSLARKKSDLLEPSLMKLSQLLRYMLYETHEKVSLKKEVEYLESYIDLQKQRFGNSVAIETSFAAIDEHHEIEPMLLIPFVENAFKHGVVLVAEPRISIALSMEKDTLHFHVHNSCVDEGAEIKDKTSGIGLGNVKRRLELLYPKKHELMISRGDQGFDVLLQIELQ